MHASIGASLLVSSSEYSHSSQAYSREIECFGRQPVSPRPNSPHRMVSRSGDSSPNFQSLGYSSDRSFRHQIKPSSAPVCFSSTGPQGLCSAMSLEWKNLFAYAFTPFKLVPLVLNKIRDSNSRFILIAPCWPQRSWFSVILSLVIDFPMELPVHRGLVSQHQGKVLHQNPAMLHLHTWMLSGVKSKVDTFLNSLPSVSQRVYAQGLLCEVEDILGLVFAKGS